MQQQSFSIPNDDEAVEERRLDLLPRWVSTYILYSAFLPIIFISISQFFGDFSSIKIDNFELKNFFSVSALIGYSLILFKLISAYGLWTEKNWGVNVALTEALLTLSLNIKNAFFYAMAKRIYSSYVDFNTFLLILFVVFLFTIRSKWKSLETYQLNSPQ